MKGCDYMAKQKTWVESGLSIQEILDLPLSAKIKEAQILSKRANTRLRALEKEGVDYGAYGTAKHHLHNIGREYFYEGKKYDELDVDNELRNLVKFIQSKGSTLTGLTEMAQETLQKIVVPKQPTPPTTPTPPTPTAPTAPTAPTTPIQGKDEDNETGLAFSKKDAKKFYQFLHSRQFKTLSQRYGSEMIVSETRNALEDGVPVEEVLRAWKDFQKSDDATLDYFHDILTEDGYFLQ